MSAQPIPVKLYSPLGNRAASALQDSHLTNGFAEKSTEGGDDIWVYKRPGLSRQATWGSGAGQGVTNWKEDIYAVTGGHLYKNGVDKGAVDGTGMYTFTSCLGATPQLFLHNRVAAYVYDDGGGLVQVVDGDYPNPTVPGCAYLDGTTYVYDTANGIHGSDFNDQTSWDPTNLILSQITPDESVALAKQLVYVVALKKTSTEVFYDAGNATGSPLAPVQGSKMNVGCRAAGTLCDVSGDLCWVGTTTGGSVKVMHMAAVKGEPISTPPVERLLAPLDFTTCWAWSFHCAGHNYYVVTLPLSNLTLAFDLTALAWYIWTGADGNYLPIVSSTYNVNAQPILQHATNGGIYTIDTAYLDDEGVAFPWVLFTPNWDGGLRVSKTMASGEVVADRSATSVNIAWSDDDFQTFSTDVSVSLDQDRPMFQDGSSFRRRAWRFTNTSSAFLRIKRLDPTIQAGSF